MKICNFIFKARIQAKKYTSCIIIQSITVAKTMCRVKHTQKQKQKKIVRKMKSVLQINEKCCLW